MSAGPGLLDVVAANLNDAMAAGSGLGVAAPTAIYYAQDLSQCNVRLSCFFFEGGCILS